LRPTAEPLREAKDKKMSFFKKWIVGAGRDPFDPKVRHSVALIAFMAWIGIGADGLSSSVYGPGEAYHALGIYHALSPLLALASAFTVIIISLGYNQVIELFPSGGGGYRVASTLLGPRAGLVSGTSLLIDYVLTISISIAACTDAIWSLGGGAYSQFQLPVGIVLIGLLTVLNIRGARESIMVLAPIFFGFIITHTIAIIYGLVAHQSALHDMVPQTVQAWTTLKTDVGMWAAIAIVMKAYSLSAGTYTGIEAVSNNVHILAEPRVRTGKMTMMYMAVSLALAAAGITLLYCLWAPTTIPEGSTLNAETFRALFLDMFNGNTAAAGIALAIIMVLQALLLIIAANAGFLGGPAVLASMAADRWAPHAFSQLSTRLVTQNGIITMGAAAAGVLWITHGDVSLLVILYSVNVFITFTLSLLGLVKYWIQQRGAIVWRKFFVAALACTLTASILLLMVIEKFTEGAWATILVTGALTLLFMMIRRHYDKVAANMAHSDALLRQGITSAIGDDDTLPEKPNARDRVAVILVGRSLGAGIHELLTVNRLFPSVFQGFVFASIGEVDTESFKAEESLHTLKDDVRDTLNILTRYCQSRGLKAEARMGYGVDAVEQLTVLCQNVRNDYPNAVFFSTKLVFEKDTLMLRLLHNQTAIALQRRLHLLGIPMMVLPMKPT
jgi:amino acid transporter